MEGARFALQFCEQLKDSMVVCMWMICLELALKEVFMEKLVLAAGSSNGLSASFAPVHRAHPVWIDVHQLKQFGEVLLAGLNDEPQ